MALDLSASLKSIPFLKDAPRRALKAAGKEARWYSVPAGTALFRAGETSDTIYFVLAGSLGAFRPSSSGYSEFIGHIRAGEPVGEMALFTGSVDEDGDGIADAVPHSNSVYALRDSEILEITRKGFDRLIKAEPEILEAMIRLILARLRKSGKRSTRAEPKVFTLVGTSPTIDMHLRAGLLRDQLTRSGYTVAIVDEKSGDDKPTSYFDELEANNDYVLLVSEIRNTSWYRLSVRQADRIWVVGRADARPSKPLMPEQNSPAMSHKLVDVILLHHQGRRQASRPKEWMDAAGAVRVFHWEGTNEEDCARLARTLSGRSVGLVLSGGGARAYAHIGAVRAMRERNVPIDLAGGTSMGAVIAACVALGWSDAEIDRNIRKGFVESNPLGDWRLPVVSMVKGHRVDNRLREHFKDVEIGDLQIPYFAVSTNLTDGCFRVHRSGVLRHVLRASIALPGILPPVVEDGEILVDGGVLNNFPADVMRDLHRGYIVGCDVGRTRKGMASDDFENPPGFFSWVLEHGFRSAPPIAGLLMRAGTINVNPVAGRELTDIIVVPPIEGVELRDWKAYDQAVEAGYLATLEALDQADPPIQKLCGVGMPAQEKAKIVA